MGRSPAPQEVTALHVLWECCEALCGHSFIELLYLIICLLFVKTFEDKLHYGHVCLS